MTISFWTSAMSTFGTLLISIFIFRKAVNHISTTFLMTVSVIWCIVWGLLDASKWLPILIVRSLFCLATIIVIYILLKIKLDTVVSAYLLSYGISNVLYFVAIVPLTLSFIPLLGVGFSSDGIVDFNSPIYLLFYTLAAALQFLIANLFFKIRRFKQGFPFLHGRYAVVAALVVSGIVLTFVSVVVALRENNGTFQIFISIVAGVIITGAGVIIWIRRGIKSVYKRWIKSHNDELHRQELAAKDRELQHYKDMHETIRAANHSIRHRQAAVERRVTGILERAKGLEFSAEISEELSVALEDIRKLSQEYQDKVDSVKAERNLPSTNIQTIDDLFGLFAERFASDKIDFKLKVSGSIIHMTEKIIALNKLETLIGDHLQDALIAVNAASGSAVRNVLAVLGETGGHYEFAVHDSGIPFEADTLARLGTERITTHAGDGGSGIGFMTTFETMRGCGASLIIKEYAPGGAFSKSVTIRFDSRNQYIIETHRPEDFPNSDRYSVKGNK